MYFEKIKGPRIYLSPMNPEDAVTYTKWMNDPAVGLGLGNVDRVIGISLEQELIEAMAKDQSKKNFAVVSYDEGLIGNCGLFQVSTLHDSAELGIFIGEQKHRAKGYGRETMVLLLHYAFDILNLHNVVLHFYSYNRAAEKAYGSFGFKPSGRRRECICLKGKYYDLIQMDLLEDEFRQSEHYNPDWLNHSNYDF